MLFLYLLPEGSCQPKVSNQYCAMIRPWSRSVRNISLLPLSSAAFHEYLIHVAIIPQACDAHRRGQAKLGDSGATPGGHVPQRKAPAGAWRGQQPAGGAEEPDEGACVDCGAAEDSANVIKPVLNTLITLESRMLVLPLLYMEIFLNSNNKTNSCAHSSSFTFCWFGGQKFHCFLSLFSCVFLSAGES